MAKLRNAYEQSFSQKYIKQSFNNQNKPYKNWFTGELKDMREKLKLLNELYATFKTEELRNKHRKLYRQQ